MDDLEALRESTYGNDELFRTKALGMIQGFKPEVFSIMGAGTIDDLLKRLGIADGGTGGGAGTGTITRIR